jgi:hypothetical protein
MSVIHVYGDAGNVASSKSRRNFSSRPAPMWRNGRRNGLRIEVLAVSLLFVAHQFNRVFPGKLREFAI